MGTTAQKLNKILETKEAIRTAINNKGGTLTTTDTFASYPSAIDSLPSGGGGSLKTLLDATKSTYFLFYNYELSCNFSFIFPTFTDVLVLISIVVVFRNLALMHYHNFQQFQQFVQYPGLYKRTMPHSIFTISIT